MKVHPKTESQPTHHSPNDQTISFSGSQLLKRRIIAAAAACRSNRSAMIREFVEQGLAPLESEMDLMGYQVPRADFVEPEPSPSPGTPTD